MKMLIALFAAALAGAPVAAQTYKWVDERGVTNYGEKPPANRPATKVDTQSPVAADPADLNQGRLDLPVRPRSEAAPPPPAPMPATAPVRGMDFRTFIPLRSGMTEAELMLRAGRPDHHSVDNFFHDIVKSYYYYPTEGNPFLTVVTLRGGRIVNLERNRHFY
jgi:hypothetical protein